jgi:hypothetical protein
MASKPQVQSTMSPQNAGFGYKKSSCEGTSSYYEDNYYVISGVCAECRERYMTQIDNSRTKQETRPSAEMMLENGHQRCELEETSCPYVFEITTIPCDLLNCPPGLSLEPQRGVGSPKL